MRVELEVRVEPARMPLAAPVVVSVDGEQVVTVHEPGRSVVAEVEGRMVSLDTGERTWRLALVPDGGRFGVALLRRRRGDRVVHTGVAPGMGIDELLERRRRMARSVAISSLVAVVALGAVLVALLG